MDIRYERIIKQTWIAGKTITLTQSTTRKEWFRYISIMGEEHEMGFTSLKAAKARYDYDVEKYTNLSLTAGL